MLTLRERLRIKGRLVVDIPEAPSFIHNIPDFTDADDSITFTWEDEGETFEQTFILDSANTNVKIFQLLLI